MGRSVAVLLAVPLSSSTLIPFLVAPYVLPFPVFSCAPSSDVHFSFLFVFYKLCTCFLCLLPSLLGVTAFFSSAFSSLSFLLRDFSRVGKKRWRVLLKPEIPGKGSPYTLLVHSARK